MNFSRLVVCNSANKLSSKKSHLDTSNDKSVCHHSCKDMLEGINIFHQVFPIQASAAEPLKVSSLHFELDAAGILLLHDIGSSNKHLPARIIESTNMRESDVKDKQQPNKVSTQTPPSNQFWCLLVHLVSRIFGKLLFNHVQASCSIDYSAKNTFRELCLQVLLKKHACCIATLLPENFAWEAWIHGFHAWWEMEIFAWSIYNPFFAENIYDESWRIYVLFCFPFHLFVVGLRPDSDFFFWWFVLWCLSFFFWTHRTGEHEF